MTPARIVFAATEIGPIGGVQRLALAQCRALRAIAEERAVPFEAHAILGEAGAAHIAHRGDRRSFARSVIAATGGRALLYVNHPNLAPIALRAARRIVHVHGIDVWTPLRWERRWALRRAHLVTASSNDTAAQTVANQGVDESRLRVLHPCLEKDIQPSAETHPPYVACVARLAKTEAAKHLEELVRAFAEVAPQHPDWSLRVAGDGDDRARLEALAAQLAPGRVVFLGRISDAELHALYASCAFFALPSAKEGFGIVYAEAMAHGKPALGLARGGVPDVIRDDENGMLLPTAEVPSLAKALSSLIGDPALRARLGAAAAATVRTRFSRDAFDRRLRAIVDEALQ